ncbi:hypothetical protein ACFL33_02615, partial [Pseudomonadota bacterium]
RSAATPVLDSVAKSASPAPADGLATKRAGQPESDSGLLRVKVHASIFARSAMLDVAVLRLCSPRSRKATLLHPQSASLRCPPVGQSRTLAFYAPADSQPIFARSAMLGVALLRLCSPRSRKATLLHPQTASLRCPPVGQSRTLASSVRADLQPIVARSAMLGVRSGAATGTKIG